MPSSRGRSKGRAHKRKVRDTAGFSPYMAHKVCGTCGKQCYLTRDEAKRSGRVNHPGQAMHVYECEEPSGKKWWHISSIPAGKLSELRDRERRIA
jgi:hypothetical protein